MVRHHLHHFLFFVLFLVLIGVDQYSKELVSHFSEPIGWEYFTIEYTVNTGAGFGILQGQNQLLIFVSIIALGVIGYYYWMVNDTLARFWLTLVGSGTLGNLVSRIEYGSVQDFIRIWVWPNFNIADMVIVIGGIGLVWYLRDT